MFKINFSEISFTLPERIISKAKEFKVNKRVYIILTIILVALSIGFWLFYYDQGLVLAYNDARSRLNIARRVFDNLQPGLAQIGSVWLPLYHVFELPLVWNDFLWHSGIAGSVPSMIAFILGGIYLLKLTKVLDFDIGATILSFAVYSLNPNLLFMQSIPMTESLLIFLSTATVYHIVSWVKDLEPKSLIYAAIFTFFATLTRYDGWFLALFVAGAVSYVAFKKKGFKFAEGNILMYLTLAGFGIILWFLWNWAIFGHPLYFALGPFSAKAQQDVLFAEGRLITKGNLVYSFFLYIIAVKYNVGVWLGILSVAGLWFFAKTKEYSTEIKIAVCLLLVPLIFNVASLAAGHSVVHIPELPPYTWFNDRYGLMVLPAVAIFVGFLAKGKRLAFIMISCILITQTYSMYSDNRVITVEDGVRGSSGHFLDSAGGWIKENVDEGLILAAASSNDALLFSSGLPLKRFILEGARLYWEQALADPTIDASWVIMHKGDLVYKALVENPKFLNNYKLVYKDDFSYIYKRDIGREIPLTKNELP